jgi:ABC-type Mn2+/Zn2+ transport system permease subunit
MRIPVIQDFLGSWPLFYQSYLSGWLIGSLLAMVGVLVVARNQIFLGAAVSQSSTLGIAVAMAMGGMGFVQRLLGAGSDLGVSIMAVLFSLAAALITSRGGEAGKESREALTGWVFLISSSLSILIVSHSPHGLEEVHRLLSSSIIGARIADVWVFAILNVMAGVILASLLPKFLLIVIDPATAAALGMKTRLWNLAISAWLGLSVGLSIRVSGTLYTFGCLALPALIAKNLCREVRSMFLAAPALAVGSGILGFILANRFDFPPAQMTVALLCLGLAAAWLVRTWRDRKSRS